MYRLAKCTVQRLDVGKEPIDGWFDLIFCMGVLEYGPAFGELDAIRRSILGALAPGGYLVLETTQRRPTFRGDGGRAGWYGAPARNMIVSGSMTSSRSPRHSSAATRA